MCVHNPFPVQGITKTKQKMLDHLEPVHNLYLNYSYRASPFTALLIFLTVSMSYLSISCKRLANLTYYIFCNVQLQVHRVCPALINRYYSVGSLILKSQKYDHQLCHITASMISCVTKCAKYNAVHNSKSCYPSTKVWQKQSRESQEGIQQVDQN